MMHVKESLVYPQTTSLEVTFVVDTQHSFEFLAKSSKSEHLLVENLNGSTWPCMDTKLLA